MGICFELSVKNRTKQFARKRFPWTFCILLSLTIRINANPTISNSNIPITYLEHNNNPNNGLSDTPVPVLDTRNKNQLTVVIPSEVTNVRNTDAPGTTDFDYYEIDNITRTDIELIDNTIGISELFDNVSCQHFCTVTIKPTLFREQCNETSPSFPVQVFKNGTVILVDNSLAIDWKPIADNIYYLCFVDNRDIAAKLIHLGDKYQLSKGALLPRQRRSRNHDDIVEPKAHKLESDLFKSATRSYKSPTDMKIYGIRIEESDAPSSLTSDNIPSVLINSRVRLRFFGTGLNKDTLIALTKDASAYGMPCPYPIKSFPAVDILNNSILVDLIVPERDTVFYFCTKYNDSATPKFAEQFTHQGDDPWMRIQGHEELLPKWASIAIICTCLCFSALFSGLNLGLLSLDRTELKILVNTGTPKERAYAKKIQPVRDHGNYLLCSILLGNVFVNSIFTILMDSLTSGIVAVVASTILIVLFGEITPQAVCSRYGLRVGAQTIYVTKGVMLLTFPLSYPVSKVLDYILGEEIGNVYNRERLKELVRVTTDVNDLDKDEVNIISGALELRKKTVADVMTHIEDVFMLSYDAILDFETVSEIMKSGFSRIPVYEGERSHVLTLLFIKDLAFVDPDDNTPLRTLCEFYQNPCHFVFEDVTLDFMFRQFKEGNKGHMAFVHRVNSEGEGDPYYETIGLITLEDVIEELIQAEIMDETDVYTDNRTKVKRSMRNKKHDFTLFAERRDNQRMRISPQLTLATFQFLTTTIDAFKPATVSETILRRLLNQDIVHNLKSKGKEKGDPSLVIYQQGKPVDYFVLILEGRVEVTVGRENLMFESGPFTYFGTQALVQSVGVDSPQQQVQGSLQSLNMDAMLRHTFVPDYSVRAVQDVVYIAIKRTLYLAAKRATLMERSQKVGELGSHDPIDDEVEKLLHSLDEDNVSIGKHTANLNIITPRASKPASNAPSPTDRRSSDITFTNGPTNSRQSNIHQSRSNSVQYSPALHNREPSDDTHNTDAPLLPRGKH